MSTDLKREIISTSSEQTEQLGNSIGAALRGGEVLQLVSDLGGGKTTLTKGIAVGIGFTGTVASPTFTISKEYRGTVLTIKHYDFYRLADAGIVLHELLEDIAEPNMVAIIEWADIVKDMLPADVVTISIEQLGNTKRKITLDVPESKAYLIKDI